ncbi:Oidioi.mRNA.OKI2018_I69.PAR.g9643.t2.cds [Oikopleura dioica]|uniref:Oidioi.mRNA.OKI2018_I69.PAR.g9643.t2.cds n=1 Tax=Oikopleura dioica TaxID=34765 RepID=A0ABN7RLP6_OIKDI|nr:Oidioi.mRNA.OKI2018_I69.PAR.g9643.t2.cds [Oikopleura dioica]
MGSKGDANRDNNLDATYRITPFGVNGYYDYSYDVNRASDGFSTQSGYINQCFDNSRYSSNTNGRVLNFLMNYADIRNDVEYGYQEMTCQNVAAQWSNWSAWGRCSQSCAGGVTQRTRSCVSGGVVANDLAGNAGCGCPGSATESQPCNTFCCPVWQICTAETCGNSDWTPLTAENSADFGFGACPDCGDKTLELTRHCKCQEADGRFRFGDLTVPAFSTTFAHFQHDCTLATGETVENSFAGIPYIAKQTKVCDGSCCEGWQPWGEWGVCDDSCFDSQNGALNATDFPRFQSRQRTCGCNGTEVATDFSNCPSLDGTQFLPLETEQRACASTPNPCPYWAAWGPYSACSATCQSVLFDAAAAPGAQCTADPADAGALRTRERGCLFGDVGSAGCPEPDRSETIACQLGDCCQYDQWSAWGACLTDAGESCTANGQPGKQTRQRNTVCGDPTVCDNCNHVEECELPKCPAWAEWGHWSECSMSCGQGTKSRTRDCCGAAIGSDACPCHGDFDIPQCDFGGDTCTNYYKTGAQLALWTARVDNNLHDANDQGYIDIMDCQVKPVCPYLQKWRTPTNWCGLNGAHAQQRVCVFGQLGVDPECSGMIHEDRPCSGLPCPRVSEWEAWSDCSVTCGMGGDRSRVRTCEKPANVTADCTEPLIQNQACRNSPCPMLTMWSQWTACSEECDSRMGVTTRERTCEHGMIGEDGCDESAYQSQFCNQDVPCPSWGSWSAWTACREISQNIFAHSRTRSCVNGPLGSRECPVDGADQEAPCDSEFCAQTQVGGVSDDNEVYIPRGAATSVLISFTSFLLALFL